MGTGKWVQYGIANQHMEESFTVYPNPVTGNIVKISLSGNWTDENAALSITNISGQLIYSEQIQISDDRAVDISIHTNDLLKSGLYILSVKGENITRYAKLIIR